jgi:hypothetical protein
VLLRKGSGISMSCRYSIPTAAFSPKKPPERSLTCIAAEMIAKSQIIDIKHISVTGYGVMSI